VPLDRSSEWQQLGLESLLQAGAEVLVTDEDLPAFLRILTTGVSARR
jgi:hypothetical protein